jgi:hypothetical protein
MNIFVPPGVISALVICFIGYVSAVSEFVDQQTMQFREENGWRFVLQIALLIFIHVSNA